MRVVAFVATVILSTALLVGAGFLVAVHSGDLTPPAMLAAVGAMVLLMVPVAIAAYAASWDRRAVPPRRRRLALLVLVAVELLAAAAIIAWAVIVAAPWWIPVLFVGVGAVLLAISAPIGTALRRAALASSVDPAAWSAVTPADWRRWVRRVIVGAVVGLAVGVTGIVLLAAFLPEGGPPPVELFVAPPAFGALGASIVGAVASFRVGRGLRQLVAGDATTARRFGQTILHGEDEVRPDEREPARRYAATLVSFLRLQLVQLATLYAALLLLQLPNLIDLLRQPERAADGLVALWPAILILLLIVVCVSLLPLYVRQISRAKRYAGADAGTDAAEHVPS